MSVSLQHFLLSITKVADPQRLLQTAGNVVGLEHLGQHVPCLQGMQKSINVAPNVVYLQHLLLSVRAVVDQQSLLRSAENAVNSQTCSQTCYDSAWKLRLNRYPSAYRASSRYWRTPGKMRLPSPRRWRTTSTQSCSRTGTKSANRHEVLRLKAVLYIYIYICLYS